MSFELQPHQPLGAEIERIASEQATKALSELRRVERSRSDYEQFVAVVDEAVHTARKALKKTRATARLMRDEIGEEVYQRENAAYRDAGRALSELRDAYVLGETLSRVRKDMADQNGDGDLDRIVARIQGEVQARHRAQRAQLFEDDSPVQEAATRIETAQRRIAEWPVRQDAYAAVRDGLRRTYRRGRKRMRDAYEEPAPARFHEWRKRVKYHWYHMRILSPLWPEPLEARASSVHSVADLLGDAHDLAVLEDALHAGPGQGNGFDAGYPADERLFALLAERRRRLEQAAQPLGARVFAESPGRFVDRMGEYWDATMRESAGDTSDASARTHAAAN